MAEEEGVHVQLNAVLVEVIHQLLVTVAVFDLVLAQQTGLVHVQSGGELASQ